MNKCILLFLFVLVSGSGIAQTYESGESYKGANDYITYHAGNLPLIISVPHGGLLEPASITDRSCSGCVTGNDTNTRALGISLKDRIKAITGCEVHVVVNELHRRKLDANREIVEAAVGDMNAETAWTEFHAFIDSAKMDIKRNWGRGLLIDLHGHGHDIQRLELGYRVSSTDLRKSDSELDARELDDLPIQTLIAETNLTLSTVLRGTESLGDLFTSRGYDAVPSSSITEPASGEPYFRGGYITDRYGSKDGSSIDAIQIECNQDVRFITSNRDRFADSLAVVLLDFLNLHYHMNLTSGGCQPTSVSRALPISEVKVYPNPVCGRLNISLETDIDKALIYNNLGQIVYRSRGQGPIYLDELPNGIYHLLIESSDMLYRQRISVQCK